MPDEDTKQIIDAGMAGRLAPGSRDFERFINITARRPAGEAAMTRYRNPTEHFGSFRVALEMLDLGPDDVYLELGFGGGQLIQMALRSAVRAAGIDHSTDMLAIASELNADAIAAGRLELVQGDVGQLPWDDATFTCAAAVNMWFFVEDPDRTLRELLRVLRPGGRLVIVTTAPSLEGGSGPWAPALRTYPADRMEAMVRAAGFVDAEVTEPSAGMQVVRAGGGGGA